ncbi:MAG: NTP transferase domain-containing protein [Anaerolineales bacterium]|nr:NTP transferase domain-containing protein [Anaerolineales bacterium]MCB0016566.1 NTP transferase domain-containing protein [Anaerolineales bacterium]MCB0026344.1 NTP transferase domain-containing protein [Anaerolineales bacterium]MCB8962652.1 NTP transferase domain-containing protein [Ardenticatenales bacterium]
MMSAADIPVVILVGGQGTRMRGSTMTKKELVEVGGRPILWHVMRIFSVFGHNQFLLALGYEGAQIKRYFLDYEAMTRDFTVTVGGRGDMQSISFDQDAEHPTWQVSLIDTGIESLKGERLARLAPRLNVDRFFVTYGDGVGNIDLAAITDFHERHGKLATVTAVQVASQYGIIETDEAGQATNLQEKPRQEAWINGGFMLLERPVLDRIVANPAADLETEVLPQLAAEGELMVYRHTGFWHSMDTMKDTMDLEKIWQNGAPWKIW